MKRLQLALAISVLLLAAGCGSGAAPEAAPAPRAVTVESVGHYCGMALNEHKGPKGQIFLKGQTAPVWFSSIKQVFAYTLLPEEPKGVSAIYVNDMSTAGPDGAPDPAAWIDARQAFYVIEGRYIGGMGAEDAIPFSQRDRAQAFADTHGGRVVTFADVPESYVFAQ
ncbi:nitrous oxide reductase accessory protein NosL [Achromobacter sp.]|uniref:nitrous oxide reductase accessory protein NosL n=1 Tax=Achromobacter sp. TaxID=134375 RepID=UPI003C763BDC